MATKVITHFTTKPKSIDERIEAGKVLREKHPIIQFGESQKRLCHHSRSK